MVRFPRIRLIYSNLRACRRCGPQWTLSTSIETKLPHPHSVFDVSTSNPKQALLSQIPGVDRLLDLPAVRALSVHCDRSILVDLARDAAADLRNRLREGVFVPEGNLEARIVEDIERRVERLMSPSLRRVINASGVVLHTNLGRAPIAEDVARKVAEIASGYSNLEYDLVSGDRGSRIDHVESLLCRLTNAESAALVNNNAAAVLIALNTLAEGGEAIVSRGQLVEIGGSFRIPAIMERSGARMVEVGTTNRTHAGDYEAAITDATSLLLSVHPSNFRVEGFTAEVSLSDLVEIGARHDVPVLHDLGGGVLHDVRAFGLPYEPIASESVEAGADVVTFSGDKMLGGPQCGILVGKRDALERIRRNPLMRALRCDKITYLLLEETLKLFLNASRLPERHPVTRMLTESVETVRARAGRLATAIGTRDVDIVDSAAQVGSGALPVETIPSAAVIVRSSCSAGELARRLRLGNPPVVGYVRDDALHLDLRTVPDDDVQAVADAIQRVLDVEWSDPCAT